MLRISFLWIRFENYKVLLGNIKDKGWSVPPEFAGIDTDILGNFLDKGEPMNITHVRPLLGSTVNLTVQELHVNNVTNVASYGDTESDYYSDDGEETDAEWFVPKSDDLTTALPLRRRKRTAETATLLTKQENREIRRTIKQEKQNAKEERRNHNQNRKTIKRHNKNKRKSQRKSQKILRPKEIRPEGVQRIVGNTNRDIDSFSSVEDILVSGIPIHLYDLKGKYFLDSLHT